MESDSDNLRVKVVIAGNSNVGKTSLIKRITYATFHSDETSTVGVAYDCWTDETPGRAPLEFLFWDTAGQEKYRSVVPICARDAEIAFLCYAVTDVSSFFAIDEWHKTLRDNAPHMRSFLIVTKTDLRSKCSDPLVAVSDGQAKGAEMNAVFIETSAMTGQGIEELKALLSEVGETIVRLRNPQQFPNSPSKSSKKDKSCC
jgi:small GTP-binding protein